MIAGYMQANLMILIERIGEEKVKSILSDFLCPLNKDVENFLLHKSVEFSKQSLAATHLVFASYKNKPALVGYFALANKVVTIPTSKMKITKTFKRKINKFMIYDPQTKSHSMSIPLIAQLGKNFKYKDLITGDELLKLACDKVSEIQINLGGKVVYLECEDNEKLKQFYLHNGFVEFGSRELERDELEVMNGTHLIQMMKYLKKEK